VSPYLRSRRKRALDLLACLVLGTLAAPVVGVAIVLVRLESPGHPIYRQRRVGRDGEPFELYKLRTMVSGAEKLGKGLAVDEGDDRITRVGAWLRRMSIDELPNLQAQVDRYSDHQRRRLDARPGLTGWAQVNGRASLPWAERIELDVWYIEHATLWLDLKIIARSARMAVTGHGLYRGETGGWREPPATS
jgi:lipopolysaccharide/colanic/teichoic acid biosynthesis glycosyltransferase